jgi:hypothetical protein
LRRELKPLPMILAVLQQLEAARRSGSGDQDCSGTGGG